MDIIIPKSCFNCGAIGAVVCVNCLKNSRKVDFPVCVVCDRLAIDGITHKICFEKGFPVKFVCAYEYRGIIKKAIRIAKFGQRAYTILTALVESSLQNNQINVLEQADLIIPIPQSEKTKRLLNHAYIIAEVLSKSADKPIVDILEKSSLSQKKLNRQDRKVKIHGKIGFKYSPQNELMDKTIVLADDISTTGSTFIEASKVIMAAGAKEVICYALAKDFRYNIAK